MPQLPAIPLTGLTAYQGIVEELDAKPGETVLIPGGSGSFGQMAVPIAKALGLRVIVTGNGRAREQILALGADQYIDYKKETTGRFCPGSIMSSTPWALPNLSMSCLC